jgi:hypothetical protein
MICHNDEAILRKMSFPIWENRVEVVESSGNGTSYLFNQRGSSMRLFIRAVEFTTAGRGCDPDRNTSLADLLARAPLYLQPKTWTSMSLTISARRMTPRWFDVFPTRFNVIASMFWGNPETNVLVGRGWSCYSEISQFEASFDSPNAPIYTIPAGASIP